MNIKKIIREEIGDIDDFKWIRDVEPTIPITELGPEDKFMIVDISGPALDDYHDWGVGKKYNPYKEIFIMDEQGCFTNIDNREPATNYANTETTDVWLIFYDKDYNGTWISVDNIMVQRV